MGMTGSMQYVDGSAVPVYGFWVHQRPTRNSPAGYRAYVAALQEAGRGAIDRPIESNDVEVEVLYVTRAPREALDVDNLGKPTLDALKGVAYLDDRQVRAFRVAKFDKTQPGQISGRIGPITLLWHDDAHPHAVWIFIYSASRKTELRGRSGRPPGWEKHVMLRPWNPGE